MTNIGSNWIYIVGIIGLIFIIVIILKGSSNTKNYKLKQFLTKNEKDFFNHLIKIFPEKYICPQVSMGAVLQPLASIRSADKYERSMSATMRNKIGSKIIDYIVLGRDLEPEFIIELDDNTHNSKVSEDNQRDLNLSQAGLPTIRVRRVKGRFPDRNWFDHYFD